MDKRVYRNIAVVTGLFIVILAVMLGVSWVQMQRTSPLQTEVMETLKELNDRNADNPQLQMQIRQLDLLARKAYFTHEGQLRSGIWILCAMAAVLVLCLRLYYREAMNLPEKDMDPIDEWMNKSRSRRYITWATVGGVVLTLFFAIASSALKEPEEKPDSQEALLAESNLEQDGLDEEVAEEIEETSDDEVEKMLEEEGEEEKANEEPLPKITSNAFRGNNSSGRSSARNIATAWNLSDGRNLAWKAEIPRQGFNSPVINGRNIFLTGADAQARELYCFDILTGELRWTEKADNIPGSPSEMPDVAPDTGLAASTVATNGNQVCAIFATGDLICTDMDGKRLWAKNLGLPDNHYGYASSLLMYGNILFVQYDNNDRAQLLAFNAANGNPLWSVSRKDHIAWSSPIIARSGDRSLLVVMGEPSITAYDPVSGAEVWRVECMSGEVGASPCADNGIIFAASEYATVIAIDGKDGSTLWEASDYMPECSSPTAANGLLYVATSYGVVCAYDAESGELAGEHEFSDTFYSSPMVADGKVYLFGNSGKCYIFSANRDFKLLANFDTGEATFATPAFTEDRMVVRTDKTLYVVKKN